MAVLLLAAGAGLWSSRRDATKADALSAAGGRAEGAARHAVVGQAAYGASC